MGAQCRLRGLLLLVVAVVPADQARVDPQQFGVHAEVLVEKANNMNQGGPPYQISNPEGSTPNWKGTPGVYSTDFQNNVRGIVEHFDVYGEVQTKYSQVYWTRNAAIELPAELVERFHGKVMAITGYEVDQVARAAAVEGSSSGAAGLGSEGAAAGLGGFACYPDCSQSDTPVPIHNAYNHPYFSWLVGAGAEVVDLERARHVPHPTRTAFRRAPPAHGFPTTAAFKQNAGGEFRKSYHGHPSGYAQLVHSPQRWVVEPMQIDTHNRQYPLTDPAGYRPSFLPQRDANASEHASLHGGLSPLIACPCTDRIARSTRSTSTVLTAAACQDPLTSPASCTAAVADLATVSASESVHNASLPSGCVMVPDGGGRSYTALFNSAPSDHDCSIGSRGAFEWSAVVHGAQLNCARSGGCLRWDPQRCPAEHLGQCAWASVPEARRACALWEDCAAFFCGHNVVAGQRGRLLCFGRSHAAAGTRGSSTEQAWHKVYAAPETLRGEADVGGLVRAAVEHDGETATITLAGPDDATWFGLAFDAESMADAPYAIIVDGRGAVTERRLANHAAGRLLAASVRILSSEVSGGTRTVVLSRKVQGATSAHYSFPAGPGKVDVIAALGGGPTLAHHRARGTGALTLLPTTLASCVCRPTTTSFLTYMDTSTQELSGYSCADEAWSDEVQHGDGGGRGGASAECGAARQHGALQCCQHGFFLTDRAQAALIPEATDTYFLKWRFYFQEYSAATALLPASHRHLHHWAFLIDQQADGYEEGTAHDGEASTGWMTARLRVRELEFDAEEPAGFGSFMPVVATPHLHAPTALREELWNADTGELICNSSGVYGGRKWGPVAGALSEAQYVTVHPCLFGDQPGLQSPFRLAPDTNLTAIKFFNNTYSHPGHMAQWTGLGVFDNSPY